MLHRTWGIAAAQTSEGMSWPSMSSAQSDSAEAAATPSDSELWDLMDAEAERESFLCVASDVTTGASASMAPLNRFDSKRREEQENAKRPSETLPRSILIGGSLFDPPEAAALRRRQSLHYQSLSLHGRTSAAVTSSASVFCPFTLQFVSLQSPHWSHLQRAGFRLSRASCGARCVVLYNAAQLCRYARRLQSVPPAHPDAAEPQVGQPSDPSSTAHVSRKRHHDCLYASWNWSFSLRQSLGALLCTVPLHDLDRLRAAVGAALHTRHNYNAARVIRCDSLLPLHGHLDNGEDADGSEGELEEPEDNAVSCLPWRVRWRDLQCRRDTTVGDGTSARSSAAALFVDGTAGEHSNAVLSPRLSAAHSRSTPSPSLHTASSWCLPRWVSAYTARATLPLLGLPLSAHAAYVSLPFPTQQTDACDGVDSTMAEACVAVMQDLAMTARSAHRRSAVRLYYCPLAHSIDYSALMDLFAFPVPFHDVERGVDALGESSDISACFLERLCGDTGTAVPVLSLGTGNQGLEDRTENDDVPAPRVVVMFSNAHLLSKRAISRLLDQWTRNGAAAQCRRAGRRQTRATRSPGWQTLMGSHVPLTSCTTLAGALPFMRTLTAPFGDVQAVFVGYSCSTGKEACSAAQVAAGKGLGVECLLSSAAVPKASEPRATSYPLAKRLHLAATPRAGLLYVEESLAAALLRVSALYRLHMTLAERRDFLETVVRAVLAVACRDERSSVQFVKRSFARLMSGEYASESQRTRLDSSKGRVMLYEACEAVLSSLSPLDGCGRRGTETSDTARDAVDGVVRLLTMYPTLTDVRVRHALLHNFDARLENVDGIKHLRESAATATKRMEETVSLRVERDQRCAHVSPVPSSRVRFVLSRQDAIVGEAAERHRLLRWRAPRQNSVGDVSTTSVDCQTYHVYAEPAVLLGRWWTSTLLFCAPTLADVMPLRSFLLGHLNALAPEQEAEGHLAACAVEDVDIFHADFIDGDAKPAHRTHKVFGARALLRVARGAGDGSLRLHAAAGRHIDGVTAKVKKIERAIQDWLKDAASGAHFFPLWTYHRLPASPARRRRSCCLHSSIFPSVSRHQRERVRSSSAAAKTPSRVSSARFAFSYVTGVPAPRATIPDFDGVTEEGRLWIPCRVERRLFTLAAAQRPVLTLVRGSRVVLREAAKVPAVAGVEDALTFPRGAVCEVVDFLTWKELLSPKKEQPLPWLVRRQVRAWTVAEHRQVQRYLEQQRHASALPVVRALQACEVAGDGQATRSVDSQGAVTQDSRAGPFVVVPRAALVGGYRSMHYYGLPLLHLPLHVLIGTYRRHGGPGTVEGSQQKEGERTPRAAAEKRKRGVLTSSCASAATSAPSSSLSEQAVSANSPTEPTHAAPSSSLLCPASFVVATSPHLPLDALLAHVLHPYHADAGRDGGIADLCLTLAEREEALRLLFAQMELRESALNSSAASTYPLETETTSTRMPDERATQVAHSPISFVEDVLFCEVDAPLRDVPSKTTTPTEQIESRSIEPLQCPLLTELALYARVRVDESGPTHPRTPRPSLKSTDDVSSA